MHYLFQFREITCNLTDFLELVTHKGSSIKYVRSDFVILTQPRPPVRAHTLLAYTPFFPSKTVPIVYFKEDMAQTNFANYYQSKNHQQCYKIKEPVESEHQKRTLGSSLRFSTVQARWKWITLAI